MRIVRASLGLLVGGLLILPLAVHATPPEAQQSDQTQNKEAQKSEPAKVTKKTPRVWTNDDFPSEPAKPQKDSASDNTAANPKPPTDKDAASPAQDSEEARLAKLSADKRKETTENDETTVQDADLKLKQLRDSLSDQPDDAHIQAIVKQINHIRQLQSDAQAELDILQKLPPPQDSQKDAGTNPTPPAGPEIKNNPQPPN